jgi:fumarate hydratase class I
MLRIRESLLELIRKTSTELPSDVLTALKRYSKLEHAPSTAANAFSIIYKNIELACSKVQPLCQDTGSILFYVDAPIGFDFIEFESAAKEAVKEATRLGYLRQNSVDTITGKNDGTNIGPGAPVIHFHPIKHGKTEIRLILKGGGCENVGAQYSLPYERLKAGRDLEGCRKVILDAVLQAQGKGCSPGALGVCIGGDRATGFEFSKRQFLRKLDDENPIPELRDLEKTILEQANQLGIGPMGFGGQTTLFAVKIGVLNRVPASYFVSISYMCWAFRRQGIELDNNGMITNWLY